MIVIDNVELSKNKVAINETVVIKVSLREVNGTWGDVKNTTWQNIKTKTWDMVKRKIF